MKIIKLYEEFWGRKSKSKDDDLEFDFLVAVGNFKKAVTKVVEVHEKHYYDDTKITNSDMFQSGLKSYIDSQLNNKSRLDDLLDLTKHCEKELYNDDKFGIDSDMDYSLFGIFEDLSGFLSAVIRDKSQRNIENLNGESQHVLDNCDDSWVFQQDMETSNKNALDALDSMDLDNLESEDEFEIFDRWETAEGLQKDLENYIGKKLEDFQYGDKLTAYKYVENHPAVKMTLEGEDEDMITQVNDFLHSLKEFFEL